MGWSENVSKRWTVYDTPSLTCKTSGVTTYQHPIRLRTRNGESNGPQMAISSPQPESSEDMPFLGPEESKRCYKDVVREKRSNGNEITEVNDDEFRHLHEEKNPGPQTAATLSQSESANSTPFSEPEELKQHHRDVVHRGRSYRNVDTIISNDDVHRLQEEGWCGIQKATTSSQSELVNGRRVLVTEEARRHRDGVVNTRRSYTNVVPGIDDDETSRLSKEMVNERRTVHYTPSPTNKGGGVPAAQ
jgi:hypothetical protein